MNPQYEILAKCLLPTHMLEWLELTNASAESLNAKIKDFRAQLRGVIDKKLFIFKTGQDFRLIHTVIQVTRLCLLPVA